MKRAGKLSLNKTTLRSLTPESLRSIAAGDSGGATAVCPQTTYCVTEAFLCSVACGIDTKVGKKLTTVVIKV